VHHVPEGTLRRLIDEPFAVPDAQGEHVAACRRCTRARERVARDAAVSTVLFVRPQAVPDVDGAWRRFQSPASDPERSSSRRRPLPHRVRRTWRVLVIPVPAPAVLAMLAVLVAGAAVGVATALAPSPKRATAASSPTIEALADFAGIGKSDVLGGFGSASGSLRLPFGALEWSSQGAAHAVRSIEAAEQATGLRVPVPRRLPPGVGAPAQVLVQPKVTATLRLGGPGAAALAGKSLTVTAGPAVLVEYGGSITGSELPTLATFVMERPSASATTSTAAQLEAFVLSEPGVPAGFAQEVRLVDRLGTVLPVPTLPGAHLSQVDIDGAPGILVSDTSIGASGVIWQDQAGTVHAAVGLLDEKDLLGVANQLG
jgi:hypothetical protein